MMKRLLAVWHARRYGAAGKQVTVSGAAPLAVNFALAHMRLESTN